MTTSEEKNRISKLLKDLEITDVKLSERCQDLVKHFHEQFDKEVEEEEAAEVASMGEQAPPENPYRVEQGLLEETERKLKMLLAEGKRAKKKYEESVKINSADPKRPWRTNSTKEKLLRLDNELRRHHEKASDKIMALPDQEMSQLIKECDEEGKESSTPSQVLVQDVVDAAKKNLPNFQYRKIENSTANAILPEAHSLKEDSNVSNRSGSGDEVAVL